MTECDFQELFFTQSDKFEKYVEAWWPTPFILLNHDSSVVFADATISYVESSQV